MTAILPQLADVFVNFPQCEHRNGYIDSLLGRIELAGVDIDKSPCAALERITLQFLGIRGLWNAFFGSLKQGFGCLLNGCG